MKNKKNQIKKINSTGKQRMKKIPKEENSTTRTRNRLRKRNKKKKFHNLYYAPSLRIS